MPGDALDVFISYSHEDKTLRQELEEQLVRLRREGLIGTWHERRVTADEAWRGWIDRDLMSADLILLIVSAPFLESDYSRDAEIKHALKLQALGHAKVMPIIARPCDWRTAPFAKLATLPQGVRPVTEWHDRDSAWEDVAQGIGEVAHRLITARLESTAEFRVAVRSPARKPDPPAATPAEEISAAGTPRSTILAGVAAALAAVAAVWFLAWWSQRSEDGTAPIRTAEMKPLGAASGQDSLAADEPRTAATAIERPSVPQPPAAIAPRAEPDVAETSPAPPEEIPPPDVETALEDAPETVRSRPAAATEAGAAEPAKDDAPPEPAAEPRKEDLERSLGILATPGAESEGNCLAVLVAGQVALTSSACAQESSVIVMGGNALTATRDEIFDLEPRQSAQANGVDVVRLLQGLDETWGFAATRFEDSFDYPRLSASYVASSQVRSVACVWVSRLTDLDRSGLAYVENAALDRYVGLVEEAADEAISIAGAGWTEALHEALASAEANLEGFVCDLPQRPPGNLVFSAEGRVVGIGYPCEPFDVLEAMVRDHLPPEIRGLDLDCIASLGEIREDLSEIASP